MIKSEGDLKTLEYSLSPLLTTGSLDNAIREFSLA